MRFIALWNADHLTAINTYTSMTGSVMMPFGKEGSNSNILSPGTAMHYSVTRTLNGLARRTLNLRPASTGANDLNIFLTIPSVAQLVSFQTAGVKKHFFAVRIYTGTIASGGKYIQFGTDPTGWFNAASNTEYFIEVVTDLVSNVRMLYINGGAYDVVTLPGLNGQVHIGNYNTGLLTATSHNFDIVDAYVAVAETDEDAAVTRLGKFVVKTAVLDSVSNDAKFTPVPASSTIKDILNLKRDATGSQFTYVSTDSNESKLGLHWSRPDDTGVGVAGAALRVTTTKVATNQAVTVANVEGGDILLSTNPDTLTYVSNIPVTLPTPSGGWSEDAIANLDIKVGSKRNV